MLEDLTGRVVGELTVRRLSSKRLADGKHFWYCDCSCGKKDVEILHKKLTGKSQITKSCGHIVT